MGGSRIAAWSCLGAWILGLAVAGLHLAGHGRPHVHEANGSVRWLTPHETSTPLEMAEVLDPRALLEALEKTAGGESDSEADGEAPPPHEARGPQHLAIAWLAAAAFELEAEHSRLRMPLSPEPDSPDLARRRAPGDARGPPLG